MSNETITIKDGCIVIDVLRPDTDFGVTSEWRLERIGLVVGKHVEVPDRTTSWLVTVKRPRQTDLSRMLVDDKSSVVRKLTGQAVADVRITIYVRICRSYLCHQAEKQTDEKWQQKKKNAFSGVPQMPKFT